MLGGTMPTPEEMENQRRFDARMELVAERRALVAELDGVRSLTAWEREFVDGLVALSAIHEMDLVRGSRLAALTSRQVETLEGLRRKLTGAPAPSPFR